jgi:hypothetical protein
MAASTRQRTPTSRDLAEDEYRTDQIRGRRYCPVHRSQQMMPLLPGLDVCPVCPEGERRSQLPQPTNEPG